MPPASDKKRFYADLLERVSWTFVQAFLGIWAVAGFDFDIDILKAALVAALIAAVKSQLLGKTTGNEGTASTLPAELDPATPPPVDPEAGVTLVEALLAVVLVGVVLLLFGFHLQ